MQTEKEQKKEYEFKFQKAGDIINEFKPEALFNVRLWSWCIHIVVFIILVRQHFKSSLKSHRTLTVFYRKGGAQSSNRPTIRKKSGRKIEVYFL